MKRVRSHSYHGYGHDQLRRMLDSADPQTVRDTHAAAWNAVDQALGELGVALNATVIHGHWSGPAAAEFQRRLAAVAECAGSASNTAHQLWNGLDYLAADIETAQREMPAEPGRNVLNPNTIGADGTVGSSQGFVQAMAARKTAGDRAAQVMDQLGRQMQGDAEYWWPQQLPAAPADMPHTPDGRGVLTARSGPGTAPGTVPAAGAGGSIPGSVAGGVPVHPARFDQPAHGSADTVGHRVPGTGLAGVVGPVAAGPGVAVSGLTPPPGLPVGGSTPAVATPVVPGMASGSGLAAAGRPPVAARPAMMVEEPVPARTGGPVVGSGGTGRRPDEPAEHHTWLTEDELVWQDRPAPPSLIE